MLSKLLLTKVALAGLTFLVAAPALAFDDGAAKPSKDDPSRRICRTVVPTGSRMIKRYCKTRADWEADAERAQRAVETSNAHSSLDSGMNSNNTPGGPH